MTILVTRPSPQGEELVSRLRAQGRVAWSFPLIDFSPGRELRPLSRTPHSLGDVDVVFARSTHAVSAAPAERQQQPLHWPTHRR